MKNILLRIWYNDFFRIFVLLFGVWWAIPVSLVCMYILGLVGVIGVNPPDGLFNGILLFVWGVPLLLAFTFNDYSNKPM